MPAEEATRLVHMTTVPLTLWSFLGGQVGYMKSRGFEVHALSSPGDLLDAFAERESVPVHAVAMSRRITPLRDLRALLRLYFLLRQLRPAIVHAHTPKGGLLGMIASWLAGVPVRIYQVHGLPMMAATGPKRLAMRWSDRVACLLAHRVVCVSRSVRQVAVAEGLCPARKAKVLLEGTINGVDASVRFDPARLDPRARAETRLRLGIPEGSPVVGFVGRLARDKGLVELLGAWKLLLGTHPDLHLLVVGPTEREDPLPTDVETTLRGEPRIHLTGPVADTPPLFAAMDVLALPSYREGFGQVLLEAAAMRLPTVASRIAGCSDAVLDGKTGTLVPPRDAVALAGAIRNYLDDPALRLRHGRAGRERVTLEFRQEDIWAVMEREYRLLLIQSKVQRCGFLNWNLASKSRPEEIPL